MAWYFAVGGFCGLEWGRHLALLAGAVAWGVGVSGFRGLEWGRRLVTRAGAGLGTIAPPCFARRRGA